MGENEKKSNFVENLLKKRGPTCGQPTETYNKIITGQDKKARGQMGRAALGRERNGMRDLHERYFHKLAVLLYDEPAVRPRQADEAGWEALLARLAALKKDDQMLNTALDHCVDSFHLTDGQGIVLRVNRAFCQRTNVTREEVEGRSVEEAVRRGLYKPAMTYVVAREKRQITYLQEGPYGGPTITTMTPILDQEGQVEYIVSNARFLAELDALQRYYKECSAKKQEQPQEAQPMLFHAPAMKQMWELAAHVAASDSSILITGETGTGKSFLARQIHAHSPRSKRRFVEINCAAIPESLMESELFGYTDGAFTGARRQGKKGLIELADKGTLFLDEIGDMPLALQAKLLQVLQNRTITRIGGEREIPVDLRLITATNQDLETLIDGGKFRRELYYRINVIPLEIPPLRRRREDIPVLLESFLHKFNEKYHSTIIISNDALARLQQYPWPGNVRELENMVERLVVTNRKGIVEEEDLPNTILLNTASQLETVSVNRILPLREALEEVERQLVREAYERYGSSYKVAQALEISQSSANRKISKYLGGGPV